MNTKTVLSKIMNLLSKEEVELVYAKLIDGTVVESETFDVGEDLFVVGEDGTKTPAPDGEHELALKDTEGNDVLIKVISKDGKIIERENVELADEETIKAEPLPGDESKKEEMAEIAEVTPNEDAVSPEDDETEIEITLSEVVEKLAYRIEEMEKKIAAFEAIKEEEVEEMEDEELPKLDGAPIETKLSAVGTSKVKNKNVSAHERVLQRMYN
jgi:hypothetical protein